MDKLSYYNIEISYQNFHLVYNTLFDSLVCFDDEEYQFVKDLEVDLVSFQKEYPTLYNELKESGFIVDDFNELEYIKFNNHLCVFENQKYHLTINPTLDCNLKCWYCSTEYANAKHHGGMNTETVKAIQNHITKLIQKVKIPALYLDWFGGEPLMFYDEVIRPIALSSLKLTQDYDVHFSQHITTNAVLMTEKMISDMANLHFTSYQIPVDGNEKHHNVIKYTQDRSGTFKTVINNINLLPEIIPNVNITLRINFDKKTLYGIEDIIPLISEKAKKHINVDFQRVWQIKCNEKDREQLKKVKTTFNEHGLKSGYWAYSPHRFYRCYSDKLHHYAINYDGRVFKCTAQDYGDDKVIGTLNQDGSILWKDKRLSELFAYSTFDNERCIKCKSLPICMGPCIIKNYEARKQGLPIPCVFENAEYSLDSYIVEQAKMRKLI